MCPGSARNLRGALSCDECGIVEAYLPELKRCMSTWSDLVLLHGDLGFDDVILDADSGQVSVIDHTDYAIGDPALDFCGLLATSHQCAQRILDGYLYRDRVGDVLGRAATYNKMVTIGLMIHALRGNDRDHDFCVRRRQFQQRFGLE